MGLSAVGRAGGQWGLWDPQIRTRSLLLSHRHFAQKQVNIIKSKINCLLSVKMAACVLKVILHSVTEPKIGHIFSSFSSVYKLKVSGLVCVVVPLKVHPQRQR